jgi:hypothetical protein
MRADRERPSQESGDRDPEQGRVAGVWDSEAGVGDDPRDHTPSTVNPIWRATCA